MKLSPKAARAVHAAVLANIAPDAEIERVMTRVCRNLVRYLEAYMYASENKHGLNIKIQIWREDLQDSSNYEPPNGTEPDALLYDDIPTPPSYDPPGYKQQLATT